MTDIIDPDGPGAAPDSDYEVLPDGEYEQETSRALYPEVDPDALILDP